MDCEEQRPFYEPQPRKNIWEGAGYILTIIIGGAILFGTGFLLVY